MVLNNCWASEDGFVRLTLLEFNDQVQRFASAIGDTEEKLLAIFELFGSGKRVWPNACENTIIRLANISKNIYEFQAFIEQSIHIPLAAVSLRLPLIIILKDMEVQNTKIIQLLVTLRDEGRTALCQPPEQRSIIVHELDILLLQSKEVVFQAGHLLDRARFKERTYSRG